MKTFILERTAYLEFGAFGKLTADDGTFACTTVERPWENNKPFQSCIPEGRYICKLYPSSKFGVTYEVIGVPNRSAILIHAGNWPHNFQGCIGLGKKVTVIGDKLGVSSSAATVESFLNHIGQIEFKLIIRQYNPMADAK